jgi:hypothetical protein
MKKRKETQTRRRGPAHLLLLLTNTSGETSPGLEAAIRIAGRLSAQIRLAATEDLESGALLLLGNRARVLWSPEARLGRLIAAAEEFQADWIANWDGYAETKNIQAISDTSPAAIAAKDRPAGIVTVRD